jgi:hypothetical protein
MGGNQSTVHHDAALGHGDKKWLIRVWIDSETPFAISSRDSDIQIENQIYWALQEIKTRMTSRKKGVELSEEVKIGISIDGDYGGELEDRLAMEARTCFSSHNQTREIKVTLIGEEDHGVFMRHTFTPVIISLSALMNNLGIQGFVTERFVHQAKHRVMSKADFYTEKV